VRAVLDPNVVISGLISRGGAPAQVLRGWQSGHFEAIVSPLVLEELRRALAYPKLRRHFSPEEAGAAVRWLSEGATCVDDPDQQTPVRSADPGDDYLIVLAAQQNAALVSGDRHLLELSGQIPVYSPRDFLDLILPSCRRAP
jgi:putative PIN family toxin of toxin-antitoxin system